MQDVRYGMRDARCGMMQDAGYGMWDAGWLAWHGELAWLGELAHVAQGNCELGCHVWCYLAEGLQFLALGG